MSKLALQHIESFLWETVDILRGNMDGSEIRVPIGESSCPS